MENVLCIDAIRCIRRNLAQVFLNKMVILEATAFSNLFLRNAG